MEEFIINFAKDFGSKLCSYVLEQISDKIKNYCLDKVTNIKYKEVLGDVVNIEKEFLSCIKEQINQKDYDFINYEKILKNYDNKEITETLNEIFIQEKVNDNIISKLNTDIKEFRNKNQFNILLLGKDKNYFYKLLEKMDSIYDLNSNIGNMKQIIKGIIEKYGSYKIKNNNFFINKEENDENNYNCIWYFLQISQDIDKSTELNNIKNLSEKYKNTNIIFITINNDSTNEDNDFKNNLQNLYKEEIEDRKKYFYEIIYQSSNENNISELLEKKSIINYISLTNFITTEKIWNDIKTKIIERINSFASGNNVTQITNLNNQLIQIIIKKFINKKDLSQNIKNKCAQLLHNYQKFLETYHKEFYSNFLAKSSTDLIIKYRDKIDNRTKKHFDNNKRTNEDNEKVILGNELDGKMISFTQNYYADLDKNTNKEKSVKAKSGKRGGYEDDLSIKVSKVFEDYFVNKASIYIVEKIINEIKKIIIFNYNKEMENVFDKE